MAKLSGDQGAGGRHSLATILSDIDNINTEFRLPQLPAQPTDIVQRERGMLSTELDTIDVNTISKVSDLMTFQRSALPATVELPLSDELSISGAVPATSEVLEPKEEEDEAGKGRAYVPFTRAEDGFLRKGIAKYGRGKWAKIINDASLTFHRSRTRDTKQCRADAAAFKSQRNLTGVT